MDLFDKLSPGFMGTGFMSNADRFLDMHSAFASNVKKFGAFPFYNIKKVGDNKYVIELALAGYSIGDIEITLEKNVLTISSQGADDKSVNYLVKGFASRKFMRKFSLMENIKVTNAEFVNGILSVWLEEFTKEEDKPKKININAPAASQHPQLLNEDSNI